MGLFDIFGTGDQRNAANAQIAGINSGVNAATGNINSGIDALKSYGASALLPFMQNYNTAQGGVTQLQNLLGINGPSGNAQAQQYLNATPGMAFQQQQGNAAINAQAAATGQNGGNQTLALDKFNQGLASTTYQSAVNNLQPFLGASNAAASGIAGVNMGIGSGVANQYNTLGNLNYTAQTGIGNANANADLAGLQASSNMWNAIGALGGSALGAIGGGAGGMGGIGSALNSSIFGAIPGASGPTSVGGAPLASPSLGANIFGSIFSDERLKEDIQKVGELVDGQNVYSYRYKGDATPRIGLMAQEVEKRNPASVVEIGGYKAVNYGRATEAAASLARFLDDEKLAA